MMRTSSLRSLRSLMKVNGLPTKNSIDQPSVAKSSWKTRNVHGIVDAQLSLLNYLLRFAKPSIN